MKKIILFILMFLVVFILLSCKINKEAKCIRITNHYKAKMVKVGCASFVPDTVVKTKTEIKYRDTVVLVEIPSETSFDTVRVVEYRGIVNSAILKRENTYSVAKSWVENGLLHLVLDQKKQNIPIEIKDAIKETNTSVNTNFVNPTPVYIPTKMPLTKWQKFMFNSGLTAWIIIVVGIILTVLYFIFKAKFDLFFSKIKGSLI